MFALPRYLIRRTHGWLRRRAVPLLALLVVLPAAAYGVGWAVAGHPPGISQDSTPPSADQAMTVPDTAADEPDRDTGDPAGTDGEAVTDEEAGADGHDGEDGDRSTPSERPARAPEHTRPPVQLMSALEPGPRLWGDGDSGGDIRELQARLAQIDWYSGTVTGTFDAATTEAVRGFQGKRQLPQSGYVDRWTRDALEAMTSEPSTAELHYVEPALPEPGDSAGAASTLDARCLTGRALCVDKTTQSLRWVVDGDVRLTLDARFGSDELPTREGEYAVYFKSRDHVSSLYHTSMPLAMFFSGGQAVHYSPDFAATGYSGASHGCVNIRDYDSMSWLFDEVRIGDTVIVYWS